jgi:hypothetical protein
MPISNSTAGYRKTNSIRNFGSEKNTALLFSYFITTSIIHIGSTPRMSVLCCKCNMLTACSQLKENLLFIAANNEFNYTKYRKASFSRLDYSLSQAVSRKYDYIMVKKQSSFLSIHTFNNRN